MRFITLCFTVFTGKKSLSLRAPRQWMPTPSHFKTHLADGRGFIFHYFRRCLQKLPLLYKKCTCNVFLDFFCNMACSLCANPQVQLRSLGVARMVDVSSAFASGTVAYCSRLNVRRLSRKLFIGSRMHSVSTRKRLLEHFARSTASPETPARRPSMQTKTFPMNPRQDTSDNNCSALPNAHYAAHILMPWKFSPKRLLSAAFSSGRQDLSGVVEAWRIASSRFWRTFDPRFFQK